ncbi:hypothetical protein ACVMHR_008915 [Bradyrhizobium diazoefficiens]
MPSERNRKKLGDLIRIKHGFAFKGEHFVDDQTPHVLLTPGNFAIGGGFQDSKPKFYRGLYTRGLYSPTRRFGRHDD